MKAHLSQPHMYSFKNHLSEFEIVSNVYPVDVVVGNFVFRVEVKEETGSAEKNYLCNILSLL